ncbi:unnamed protein product [Soboliphyme baturini]|uniref:AAA domain-containing protein n=1 Tax=Soboliphyme baturini TaxID=241478 RepID=A0A183IZV1_9BILA|nr:unnamed protein product [Soboliphyme baturini]
MQQRHAYTRKLQEQQGQELYTTNLSIATFAYCLLNLWSPSKIPRFMKRNVWKVVVIYFASHDSIDTDSAEIANYLQQNYRKRSNEPEVIDCSSDSEAYLDDHEEICKFVMHIKHPELYAKLGIQPSCGFLLHGPPGSGKTLLAEAVAGELALPFMKLAGTEIISGVSGESEKKIRDLFIQATTSAPCVLFIDEVDAISPRRENATREMERRIVSQLLSCLDEVASDKLRLEPNFNFLQLARLCPGYVGADLVALIREASVCAVDR